MIRTIRVVNEVAPGCRQEVAHLEMSFLSSAGGSSVLRNVDKSLQVIFDYKKNKNDRKDDLIVSAGAFDDFVARIKKENVKE
ncbi:MAG: hypothetical protein LBO78_02260 [Rickettsiales bacterium]|jgi:hypothetical protein|nr:hypothetical protein [Rickettsiales bacterium]